jgi:hypothetical protein
MTSATEFLTRIEHPGSKIKHTPIHPQTRVKTLHCLALAMFLLPWSSTSARAGELSYHIDATLDEQRGMLRGHQIVRMTNWSRVPLERLFFHLFPNAMRAVETADLGRLSQGLEAFQDPLRAFPRGGDGGYAKIHSVLIEGRPAEYIVQGTWMVIFLPQALPPQGRIGVELEFCLKIPRFNSYWGHWKGITTMAKWYPQLAFLTSEGWLYQEEVGLQESLANFSDYWVCLRLPQEMVVAATGYLVRARREDGGVSVQTWFASHVRGFGWVGSTSFLVCTQAGLGVSVSSFFLPGHHREGFLAGAYARRALLFYGARLGSYPHRRYAVVETHLPLAGLSLPGLCLVSSSLYQLAGASDLLETTIAHEVAHQWWGERVDAREPWFCEGFARFCEFAHMRAHHGTEGWLLKGELLGRSLALLPLSGMSRNLYVNLAQLEMEDRTALMASQFRESLSYHGAVYAKVPLVLEMLLDLLGEAGFLAFCRGLLDMPDHHVITTDDLVVLAQEVGGRDLSWFFHQWLESTSRCDYGIAQMRCRQLGPGYETRLHLRREGDALMPVWVTLNLEDGSRLRQRWDGQAAEHVILFVSSSPPRAAELSGGYQMLDYRPSDNYYPRKKQFKSALWPLPHVNPEVSCWQIFPRVRLNSEGEMEAGLGLINGDMILMSAPFVFQRESQLRGEIWHGNHWPGWFWKVEYSQRVPFLGTRTLMGIGGSREVGGSGLEGTVRWIGGRFLCRTPYQIVKLRGRYWKTRGKDGHFSLGLELLWDGRRTVFFPTFGNLYLLRYQRSFGSSKGGDTHHRLSLELWHHRLLFGRVTSALRLFGGLLAGFSAREDKFDLKRHGLLYGLRDEGDKGDACLAVGGELRWSLNSFLALVWSAKCGLLRPQGSATVVAQELGMGLRFLGNSPWAMQMDGPIFTRNLGGSGAPWRLGWSFRWGAQPRGL